MLFYIYSNAPGTTIDITSRCRVGRMSVKDQAEEGAVAISSLIVDDPNGDIEFTGHRRMYIYESEAPIFDQVIFNGFVVNERVERGPYRTGDGRQWVLDLADNNVLINRRIMNGADANRPAETDLARIQALLTMTELNTVDDDTYVSTSATTVALDAVDYRGQNVGAYIDDCRQASGKNSYILYNETVGQYGLWYDFADSAVYDSGCFLTNGIDEANHSTIFLCSQERTHLNIDPSRVASGIYMQYDGGTVYVQDAGTTAAFAAIDWAAPSINVKSLTKATARANRYLADASTEHPIIHVVLPKVPRRSVNKIKKGQLVSFKSSYMTDYTAYTQCRVLYRTVTEISEDPEASFEIEMDLDPISLAVCVSSSSDAYFAEERQVVMSSYESFSIPAWPEGLPYAIVALLNVESANISVGPSVTMDTSGAWVQSGSYSVAPGVYWHNVMVAGYLSQPAGTPETFDGTLTFIEPTAYYTDWCLAAVAVATSASAPVQSAQNVGDVGTTVTAGVNFTAGNILVLIETNRNDATGGAPVGWTLIRTIIHGIGGGGIPGVYSYIYISARCVPEGGLDKVITLRPIIVSSERHAVVWEWTP